MKLVSHSSPVKVNQNEVIQVEMTDIVDGNSFHLRMLDDKSIDNIEKDFEVFDP
jgi:hypothetical protein